MDMNAERLAELKRIAKEHGGVLTPGDVVAAAADETSPLHSAFEWDDSEAARKYRLEQARHIIRVTVEVIGGGDNGRQIQAFVSVRSDRTDAGGYRHAPTLMRSKDGRAAILETALWELEAFQKKYAALNELADVFAAIKAAREQNTKAA